MRTITKALPTLAAVALGLTLTGCSGPSNSASGVYYGEYVCNTPSGQCSEAGDLVRLTLDGDNVTFDRMRCEGVDEEDTSQGVLNEERTSVAWTVTGLYESPSPFTVSEGGEVVTLAKTTYSKEGEPASVALVDEQTSRCDEKAAQAEVRESNEAERTESAAENAEAVDTTIEALIAAAPVSDFSTIEEIIGANGMTVDEFSDYLQQNYASSGVHADEFFAALMEDPQVARDLLEPQG